MTSLLRSVDGVGRVQVMRRLDAESPFVGVTFATADGPLTGVVDVRAANMAELFADGVAPVALVLRDVDVRFRVEVRRAAVVDPNTLDCDLSPSETRRWIVLLRPAAAADVVGPVVVDFVEPRVVVLAKAFTLNLRLALAGLCELGSVSGRRV